MAEATVNQIYMVTINGLLHNQRTMSTFYYQLFGVPAGVPTVQAAMDDLEDRLDVAADVFADYRAICPSNWTFTEAWVQCIDPVRYQKKIYAKNLPGTNANASTTTNVSLSLTRKGEIAARNRVGGVRIPLSPLSVVNGLVDATAKAAGVALASDLKLGYGAPGEFQWSPGFVTKIPGQLPNTTIKIFTPNFDVFVQDTARVMRRRTVGLGI